MNFTHCAYQDEGIKMFCTKYRAATGIVIPNKIQVLQFIAILDPHFEHWGANIRAEMRKDPLIILKLKNLS